MKKLVLFSFFMSFGISISAQIGGRHVYEFLNLPTSARVTALGSNLITVADGDINQGYGNPALLNPMMSGKIAFNHSFHLANIGQGSLVYGHYMKKWDVTLQGGLQYIDYGTFNATDVVGNTNGTFKASEYALMVGAGKQLYEKISVGVNLKMITSQLESYNSLGWVGDAGAVYQDTSKNLTISLVFRNMGSQFTAYNEKNYEGIPFESQIGFSKRLRYLPLRFSIIYTHLNRWNVLYDDPNAENDILFLGESPDTENAFGTWTDNFARHLVINGEFLFGQRDNFVLRFGYNHLRKKELSVDNFRSLAGFSMGFGIQIKRFRFDYGHAFYHLGGGSNHLTLSTSLGEFTKGKIVK